MSEVTDADRLVADPVMIEHPAGRRVELKFTMRRLVEVERQFGSLEAFEEQLLDCRRKGLAAPFLSFLVKTFDALLWDDPPAIRESRADCLDLDHLAESMEAINRAWRLFWPAPKSEEANDHPNRAGAPAGADSPGMIGITSAPSDSGAPTPPSGA